MGLRWAGARIRELLTTHKQTVKANEKKLSQQQRHPLKVTLYGQCNVRLTRSTAAAFVDTHPDVFATRTSNFKAKTFGFDRSAVSLIARRFHAPYLRRQDNTFSGRRCSFAAKQPSDRLLIVRHVGKAKRPAPTRFDSARRFERTRTMLAYTRGLQQGLLAAAGARAQHFPRSFLNAKITGTAARRPGAPRPVNALVSRRAHGQLTFTYSKIPPALVDHYFCYS